MPAPSARTKPDRFASNGREACSGSSFQSRVSAPRPPIDATPSGVRIVSDAPASSTSAMPVRIRLNAWPSASVPDAQAEFIVLFGPRTPRPGRRAPPPCSAQVRHEQRIDPRSAALAQDVFLAVHIERAAGRRNDDADLVARFVSDFQLAGAERLLRRRDRELREIPGATRHLVVHPLRRVEVLDLARNLHWIARRSKRVDARDAVRAGHERLPERLDVVANRADHPSPVTTTFPVRPQPSGYPRVEVSTTTEN